MSWGVPLSTGRTVNRSCRGRRLGAALILSLALMASLGLGSALPARAATAPTYSEVATFPLAPAPTTGQSTVSITPSAVGDLVVLMIELHSSTAPTVSTLTASNISWQKSATQIDTDAADTLHLELWYGTATATTAATTTVAYSGTVTNNKIEMVVDSFHASMPGTWQPVDEATVTTIKATSTAVQGPTLMSGTGSGLYVGYLWVNTTFAAGTTSGFSYHTTPAGNAEFSDTSLVATTTYTPAGSQVAAGDYTATAAIFSLIPQPAVTALTPTSGKAAGGIAVKITGTNFATGDTVKFGTTAAPAVTVTSGTTITATSPPGVGTVDVTVTGNGVTSATGAADKFTYVPTPPSVTSITPTSGKAAGGTEIKITGTNFATGDTVKFGTTAAPAVTVTSATTITATSPPGVGTVDVTVTGNGVTSATGAADKFTYIGFSRIYGATADATAAAELAHRFPYATGECPASRAVILATDSGYPDALASAYLARYLGTGTLLTPTASLSDAAMTAIRDEGIARVYVVGGPLAVSTSVVNQLSKSSVYHCGGATKSQTTVQVTRLWGKTRYDTAKAIAAAV